MFGNLANVYRLLHPRPKQDSETGDSRNKEARREDERVPFEGRLLVFRRGNGVEETKGRLLLKKLDYLQVHSLVIRSHWLFFAVARRTGAIGSLLLWCRTRMK